MKICVSLQLIVDIYRMNLRRGIEQVLFRELGKKERETSTLNFFQKSAACYLAPRRQNVSRGRRLRTEERIRLNELQ